MTDYDLTVFKKRYTVREFDSNMLPTTEQIDHLYNLVKYIPIQQERMFHFWVYLGPEDQEFKDYLFEEIFVYPNSVEVNTTEYFLAIKTAPVIFMGVNIRNYGAGTEKIKNLGLHAGFLTCEALKIGLDVATIGCTEGYENADETGKGKFQKRLIDFIGIDSLSKYFYRHPDPKDWHLVPAMCVCIGKGKPLTEQTWHNYKDGYVHLGQKLKKPFNNVEKGLE